MNLRNNLVVPAMTWVYNYTCSCRFVMLKVNFPNANITVIPRKEIGNKSELSSLNYDCSLVTKLSITEMGIEGSRCLLTPWIFLELGLKIPARKRETPCNCIHEQSKNAWRACTLQKLGHNYLF